MPFACHQPDPAAQGLEFLIVRLEAIVGELDMTSLSSPHPLVIPGWTPRRRQLFDRLVEQASPLAGLYASAVFFLANPTWPGRYHLLGHAVREIVQRLPDILNPQPRSRAERDEALKSFVDAWLDAGLPRSPAGLGPWTVGLQEGGNAAAMTGLSMAGGDVAVPSNVAEAAAALVETHEQASTNNYNKAASVILTRPTAEVGSLISDTDAARDATVLLWTQTSDWFLDFTHVSAKPDRKFPTEEELEHRFEIIESTLETILAPFYLVIDDLDEILSIANKPAPAVDTTHASSGGDDTSNRRGGQM